MPPVSTSDLLRSFGESQARNQGRLSKGLSQGFEFAKSKADLELRREALEQRREEFEVTKEQQKIKKSQFILSELDTIGQMTSKKAKNIRFDQGLGTMFPNLDEASKAEMLDNQEAQDARMDKIKRIQDIAREKFPELADKVEASLTDAFDLGKSIPEIDKEIERAEALLQAEGPRQEKAKLEKEKVEIQRRGVATREEAVDISKADLAFKERKRKSDIALKQDELKQELALAKTEKEKDVLEASGKELNFISQSKQFDRYTVVSEAAREVTNALDSSSPFGALKVTFKFMKALDPESAVRGSEIEGFQGTGSFGVKMAAYLNNFKEGNALKAEEIKDDLKEQMRDSLQNSMGTYDAFVKGRSKLAKTRNLKQFDPGNELFLQDMDFIETRLGGFRPKEEGALNTGIRERAGRTGRQIKIDTRRAAIRKDKKRMDEIRVTMTKLQNLPSSTAKQRQLIRDLRKEFAGLKSKGRR